MIELSKIVYSSILCLLVSNWLKLEPLTLALLFLFLFIRKRKMFEVIKHLQVQNRKKKQFKFEHENFCYFDHRCSCPQKCAERNLIKINQRVEILKNL